MMRRKIRYTIAPGFEILESWVKNLPDFFPVHGVSIFKDRNEVKVFEEHGFSLNVKAFKLANLVNRFAYVYLRGSKAARSYQNALRFLDEGASTPVPVAYVECLSYGLLKESFYVSLHFRHDFSLRDVLNRLVPDKENILKPGEWNTMRIRVVDDRVQTWLNGTQMVDLKDEKISQGNGSIALQIHEGGGIKVQWRNLIIEEL